MKPLNELFLILYRGIRDALLGALPDWLAWILIWAIVAGTLVGVATLAVLFMIWLERKLVARIQDRIGPNRAGPWGLLQSIADAIKMFTKEDIVPYNADKVGHTLAPILIVIPAVLSYAVIPFGPGMIGADLNVGLLYLIAIGSIGTLAVLTAGWASNNKFSLLGGMRAVAQVLSYEIPMALTLLAVALLAGSLSLQRIVETQRVWNVFLFPVGTLAFLIYLISAVAELNRSPFDIPEAESELVAGYHTEYSGMKFGLFFVAEYMNTLAVSAVAATLFLGGWQGPGQMIFGIDSQPILPPYLWFLLKTFFMVFVIMWIRGTLPRVRVDQLMNFAWKGLVPASLVNLFLAGLFVSFF